MRLLLDTHTFLWWVGDVPRFSARARRVIENPGNECWLSAASVWELAIKSGLGKLKLSKPVGAFVTEHAAINGFGVLPLEVRDLSRVEALPWHHRDPFDRLLVAQALENDLTIVSIDSIFARYGAKRWW